MSRGIVRRYLTAEGFNVAEAADGRETWTGLARLEPDLIVLDTLTPRVDGLNCCVACVPARTSMWSC